MKSILLQLLAIFILNLCLAQNGIYCLNNAVYTNTNFTLTATSNLTNATCTWQRDGQIIATGTSLTTQLSTAGNYNFEAICCSATNGNPNGILPLQTQITAADDPGPPNIAVPPKCVWVDHPGKAGIEIMRINDGVSEDTFGDLHQYSRRSAFTVDGKYFAMNDGRLISIEDCSVKCDLGTSSEFVLSQLDPDIAYGWSGSNFYKVNCNDVNNKQLLFSAPAGHSTYTIGRYEGQQDFNDKYVLLEYGGTAIILDLQTGSTGSTFNLNNLSGDFNWADVSAEGTYALIGTSAGVYRFNIPNFSNQTEMNIGNRTGNWHFDMMYDASGNEIMVMEGIGAPSSPQQDWAYNILATNQYLTVDALAGGGITAQSHVSGQAKNRPGWMYVSGGTQTYSNKYIFSIEVKPGNNQIECWGSTYNALNSSYNAEAKASVNPNGDMVVVSTNWNVNGGSIYEILYRPKNLISQQCETFSCTVTAIETGNPIKINGCPNGDLTAPASWNVQSDLSNEETFVIWTWTLNGQAINLPDATDPGFGVIDAGPGYYVGTMNYLDVNGLPQTQTCEINVTGNSNPPIGCPTAIVADGKISMEEPLPASGASWLMSSPFWSCTQYDNNFNMTPYLSDPDPYALTLVGLPIGEYCCNFEGIPLDANGNQLPTVYNQCCFTVVNSNPENADIYEAEAATLVGVTKANSHYTVISNGEYVTGFDNEGDKLIFDNIQAPSSGSYSLTIRYACSSYKENYVSVNGGSNQNIAFPPSSIFTDKKISIDLNTGNNTITLEKHWGWMDVDYFELVAAQNQNGNTTNDTCNRTIEISGNTTENYYVGGIINADAVISANNSVEFICTQEINLKPDFNVEKGAEFLTTIGACE